MMPLVFVTLNYGIVAGLRVQLIRSRVHLVVDLEMQRPPTKETNGTEDDDETYFGHIAVQPMVVVHRMLQHLHWLVMIDLHSVAHLRVIVPTLKMLLTFWLHSVEQSKEFFYLESFQLS